MQTELARMRSQSILRILCVLIIIWLQRSKRDKIVMMKQFLFIYHVEVHGITRASISIRAKTHAVYNMGFEPGFLHYEPEDQERK